MDISSNTEGVSRRALNARDLNTTLKTQVFEKFPHHLGQHCATNASRISRITSPW